jgi:hypothetical protein
MNREQIVAWADTMQGIVLISLRSAAQALGDSQAPATLIINRETDTADAVQFPLESVFRAEAEAQDCYVLKYVEPIGQRFLHNLMLSLKPDLSLDELIACRSGDWESKYLYDERP